MFFYWIGFALKRMKQMNVKDQGAPYDAERRFGSVNRAYGVSVTDALSRSHVVVVGIGGVGSWTVEALARSSIGILTLIDLDHIAESNINRQAHALQSTIGQAKVVAMAQRIHQINRAAEVHCVEEFIDPTNVSALIPAQADLVIDCTDQMSAKVAMVLLMRMRAQAHLVCGAAGGKTNGLTLKLGDLRDSSHDALLSRLRATLRKQHGFAPAEPKRARPLGVPVLWLDQPAHRPSSQTPGNTPFVPLACAGYGSLVTVTAAMGFAAAGYAIDRLVRAAQV
jgi:tRNA threonylcarbamoyladenosine dehydratase